MVENHCPTQTTLKGPLKIVFHAILYTESLNNKCPVDFYNLRHSFLYLNSNFLQRGIKKVWSCASGTFKQPSVLVSQLTTSYGPAMTYVLDSCLLYLRVKFLWNHLVFCFVVFWRHRLLRQIIFDQYVITDSARVISPPENANVNTNALIYKLLKSLIL